MSDQENDPQLPLEIPPGDDPDSLAPLDPGTRLLRTTAALVTKWRNRSTGEEGTVKSDSNDGQQQLELFVTHLLDANFKDDVNTMGAPVFSLATKPDMTEWNWQSADKKKWLKVYPSGIGRATMHDKDLLIYLTSLVVAHMEDALRKGDPMPSRRIQFTLHDFFVKTNKAAAGSYYQKFEDTLLRLRGTTIKTNIARNARSDHRNGFGLIDNYSYDVEKNEDGSVKEFRGIEVILSEWLYDAIQARKVLTLHSDYFNLRKPLEKRLYELARKHLGEQDKWVINANTLHGLVGSGATLRRFRSMMVDIISDQRLPEVVIEAGTSTSDETQYTFRPRMRTVKLKRTKWRARIG